jgi:hypothetical protein
MTTRHASALIVVLTLSATACSQFFGTSAGGDKKNKKLAHATIYLIPAPAALGKPCKIITIPQLLEVDGRGAAPDRVKEEVLWSIVDACNGTGSANVVIAFAAADPTENCVADSGTAGKSGKQKIRCPIAAAANATYKYNVSLSEASLADPEDPELEIVY